MSIPGPHTASSRAWSAPPRAATTATAWRAFAVSAASTSSVRKSSTVAPDPAARSSTRAGQPPRSSIRSTGTSRRAAKAARSSSAKARSASSSRMTLPCAARRASGTGGSARPLSTRWPFAGRAAARAASRSAEPPLPTSWTSSTTRQTWRGDRRHMASTRAAASAATSASPPSSVARSATRSTSAPRAVASPAARCQESSSPGPHPSQQSSPRRARAFSSTAWASRDDLPNPAPATTTVTGCSQRPCTRLSRSLRRTSGRLGRGGAWR
jgi:hypothetical protein